MKNQFTQVRTETGHKRTRVWAEFSTHVSGTEHFFKVTTRIKSKGSTGSALVVTEDSTRYRVCDVPFTIIAETRVSEKENDYVAAGIKAIERNIPKSIDFNASVKKALSDIALAEREEWPDDIPF